MSSRKHHLLSVNGIRIHAVEEGSGPLVLLVHGFPESWYSWRHQIPALAAAGYHVVAPDMRGYGKSDKPKVVEDYDIHHLTGDIVGLVDAMGEKTAILVGHDWGAVVSWNAMLLHPDRFNGYAAMSVPYRGRNPDVRPMDATRARYGENFWYTVYFQEPGVAEAEFDAEDLAPLLDLHVDDFVRRRRLVPAGAAARRARGDRAVEPLGLACGHRVQPVGPGPRPV